MCIVQRIVLVCVCICRSRVCVCQDIKILLHSFERTLCILRIRNAQQYAKLPCLYVCVCASLYTLQTDDYSLRATLEPHTHTGTHNLPPHPPTTFRRALSEIHKIFTLRACQKRAGKRERQPKIVELPPLLSLASASA